MKTVFTSDLHGNLKQYENLFNKARKLNARTIIIGGDIAPKNPSSSIENQKSFMKNKLIPLIKKEKEKDQNLLLMLGNDDWKTCLNILDEYDDELFYLVHMKPKEIKDASFIGYSFVPITPFGVKDFEKWDNENQEPERYMLEGFISQGQELIKFRFNPNDKSNNIQKDMEKLKKLSNPKNTVYIFHGPPKDTYLDITIDGLHVGSESVKDFIRKEQPPLTLHGHIHETVDMSGGFTDKIGKTRCVSSGNQPYKDKPNIIIFDTNDLTDIKRKEL